MNPCPHKIVVQWSPEDDAYIARFDGAPEPFSALTAHGDEPENAVGELMALWEAIGL